MWWNVWGEGYSGIDNFGFGGYALKTWYKFTITLDQAILCLNEEEGYFRLGFMADASGIMYVGDITLDKPQEDLGEPAILKVGAQTATQVYNPDIGYGQYVDASTLGFAGDYTGGAASIAIHTNENYRVVSPYTAEELTALKSEYTKISFWVAVDGATYMNGAQEGNVALLWYQAWAYATKTNFGVDGYTNKTWYKFTVTIDEAINCLNKEGGYFRLGALHSGSGTLYVGDITFEK